MADTPPERLHALDAARGFVLLLGIVFHATLSFLPAPVPIWIVMDNSRSLALAATFHVLHIFRMSTFFLLAGFFAHLSFHRKGLRGFVGDRLKRIGIPLLVGWPILFASIVAVTVWGAMVMANGGPLPKPPAYPGFPGLPADPSVVPLRVVAALRGRADRAQSGCRGWTRASACATPLMSACAVWWRIPSASLCLQRRRRRFCIPRRHGSPGSAS